jgi:very-short-patch-repair endonuclease
LDGLRFRRQHAIGRYVVDFYCPQSRLVIEIDGETHLGREDHDEARSVWLAGQGYRVVRFWNTDVWDNLDGVVAKILMECGKDA